MIRDDIKFKDFSWIDLTTPSEADFDKLSEELSIPLRALEKCLDPEHLPGFEKFDDVSFIILRIPDPRMKEDADTIQEVTTKIVLFLGKDFLLSVHRLEISYITEMKQNCSCNDTITSNDILRELIVKAIKTLDAPLIDLEHQADSYENHVYQQNGVKHRPLRDGYFLKRKASAYRKILKLSLDILNKISVRPELIWKDFHELREYMDRLQFYADDVLENITGLMNLQVSIDSQRTNVASYRTNEIMRVLTIFSIFFLPLNFIAGVYGMNFKYMPELEYHYGYEIVLAVMTLLSISIFTWVYRRGWLKKQD